MDRVSVRLLVTRDGIETSIEESVHSKNILSELNERIFPDVPASAKIKWIYRGRQLKDKLPPSIQPATAFHVFIQERSAEAPISGSPSFNEFSEATRTDKILVSFLHVVFVVTLSFFWNQFRLSPQNFDHISLFLMVAFSIVTLLSIAANIRS